MPGPTRYRSNGGRPRSGDRRKPPEESTGEEKRFLDAGLASGARLRIELIGGSFDEAVVRSFNENSIVIDTPARRGVTVRKDQIRTIEELD